ncbi:hypothetical protein M1C57_15585 [Rhodococcus pyridinivorans]|uniref:hypothetical protein n=1 Tax=Rhodococcus pyridinivorans TaxID=103816 RepID=UPI002009F8CF|nr:hypothetical protein [Rhodococcus pyridinivorans]UPW03092.1 hypothetical protein M1C57_15585 [Rhodococcus pyridinivorans]
MSWLVDQIETALDHAERFWSENSIAIEDEAIETAALKAIQKVTLWQHDKGYPAVRVIYPCTGGIGYYAEMVDGRELAWYLSRQMHRPITNWCGRCEQARQTGRVLYVPMGMSVVAVELCSPCADFMAEDFSPLQWMDVRI